MDWRKAQKELETANPGRSNNPGNSKHSNIIYT